jgi:uncharacterized protein
VKTLTSIDELEAIYAAKPKLASTAKEVDYLTEEYKALIAASPFVILATAGKGGLDCSPRGDVGAVARVMDDKTLAIPDRRGNNRIDSLRNIIGDPRVALLFLIPGSGTTLRVNGRAHITTDAAMLSSFETEGKLPRSVIVVSIEACYFQCARAIIRSDLWNTTTHLAAHEMPTPGKMLERLTKAEIEAKHYDSEWSERAKSTMW